MKTEVRESPTLAVVGNLTMDEVVTNRGYRVGPGGSALYVSATAAFLGSRADVVSQIGPDYSVPTLVWLKKKGIGVDEVRRTGRETCRFRLSYRHGSRTLRVLHEGSPVRPSQVHGRWKALHLGPVFGEVPVTLIQVARRHTDFLSVDLQGFLRSRRQGGSVMLRPVELVEAFRFLDLMKSTADEALVQTSGRDLVSAVRRILDYGPRYVVVTLGRKGAIFAERNGEAYRIPAYPEPNVVEPTGAGDALVGGWLPTFLLTRDPVWATSVGSGLASLIVRRQGLAKFRLSREELFRRSAWVYSRVRRMRS